ncbi:hypothetical protein BC936DRAFT_141889 [Jimgerdemannia flammicorona]|uniref:THIF-type NAD/FAD binding fold domain-containing protein n=1 Tax=Jimgerdemannia flammicorona TaxID=994334 RepID=A0A433DFM9_9FUNG|nr:hypothetical protein BC936DRAFT_141889 [Jimgerdemannia flammicorona]
MTMTQNDTTLAALFSRQLSILDPNVPTTSKLLFVGTGSTGVELVRSLLMAARFQRIVILDDAKVKVSCLDMGSPYLFQGDLDQPRLSTVTARLKESHRDTDLESMDLPPDLFCDNKEIRDKILQDVSPQMVLCSGLSILDCVDVDESCRNLQIPFGVTECFGLLCRAFFDWGPRFKYSLAVNLAKHEFLINSMFSDDLHAVCIQASYFHPKNTLTRFHSRGQIIAEGNARLHNILKEHSQCIIIIDQPAIYEKIKKAFEILPEIRCEILPAHYEVQHQSLKEELASFKDLKDISILDQNLAVHRALDALYQFRRQHDSRFPDPADPIELDRTLSSVFDIDEMNPLFCGWLRKALLIARGQFVCTDSYIANWLCSEVIKFFAKKYEPNPEQSHARGFVQVCHPGVLDLSTLTQTNGDRLDGPRMCLGADIVEKLGSLRLAVVGAGALGCEDAKNFVGIGVGRKSLNGRILYFDDDYVSHSNPTRQFCFTEDDAKRRSPKAATLVKFMTHRRPDIAMEAHEIRIGPGGHPKFDTSDAIVMSPDSELARFHCLMQCMLRGLPYFNAGTGGLAAVVDSFVPDIYFQELSEPRRERIPCQFVEPPKIVSSKEEIAEYAIALSRRILPLVDVKEGNTEEIKSLLSDWFPDRNLDGDTVFASISADAANAFREHKECSIPLEDHRGFSKIQTFQDCPKHMVLANTVASQLGTAYFVSQENYNYTALVYAKAGVQPAIITSTAIASSVRTFNLVSWIQRKSTPTLLNLRTIGSRFILTNPDMTTEPPSCVSILENCNLTGETFEDIIKLLKSMKSETISDILEKGFKICKAYIPGDSEDGEVHLAEPVVICFDREFISPPTFVKYELSRGTESNSLVLYYYVGIASSVQFKNSALNINSP